MSTGTLRIFLVRHAEAAANVGQRYLGSQDDPLTARGVEQARRLAAAFAPLPIGAVYTSPLQRAASTAAAIAAARGLTPQHDARLREMAFGAWEGLSRAEVLAGGPAAQELLERWEADPAQAPPGGESLADAQQRVVALADELARTAGSAWVVLVSHVGPIKGLLCAALGVPLTAARHMFLDPATISVVDWRPQPVVRLFNAHGHLGWEEARWMRG